MRIQSIDYLRGLMSLSIVTYHFSTGFTGWGTTDSGTLLGRLGIYAVSAFYIISGMALYLSHKNERWDFLIYSRFMARRFLRLAPIYWLGLLILTVFTITYYGEMAAGLSKYLKNISLVFGLLSPSGYMLMGGWSIGNEVVFYIFFPFFMLMVNDRRLSMVLLVSSILLFVYCSFFYFDKPSGLDSQWKFYINPVNQIYFFVFGIFLAKLLFPYAGKVKFLVCIFALSSFITFAFYPASGDQINIIVGSNKFVFTVLIVLLCSTFFLMSDFENLKIIHLPLKFLGEISYPLYLLHGVSFMYFRRFFYDPGASDATLISQGLLLLSVLILLSWICHVMIEKPVIEFSKSIF